MSTVPVSDFIPSLTPLATLSPPSTTRAWQSAPHPTLPILATATSDKTVSIYSLTSFRLLNRITGGHKRSVRSVGWRRPLVKGSTASVLATGSFDSTVGIWRKDDALQQSNSDEIEINDMKPTATGQDDDDDEEAWSFAVLLTGHDSEVKSVAFSPSNPSLLATSSRDKSVWIWEEVSGGADEDEYETIAVLTEHQGDVKCVAWNYEDEVLASGSYDDTIRLWREVEEEGDWMCVGCLEGHGGTVWCVQWEKPPVGEDQDQARWHTPQGLPSQPHHHLDDEYQKYADARGPRLISSSDDLTVRVWRRQHRTGEPTRKPLGRNKMPSIIKPASTTETWVQESVLPRVHERSVYSVAWSERTGLVVSCGGDGNLFVYRETSASSTDTTDTTTTTTTNGQNDVEGDPMAVDNHHDQQPQPPAQAEAEEKETTQATSPHLLTQWDVVAQFEGSHGSYEINHVCWALRRDNQKRFDGEEVIISTSDGGDVKIWILPPSLTSSSNAI